MIVWLWFAVFTALTYWVVFMDGAETLEGKLTSAFVIDPLAPLLSADHLRLYVIFLWFAHLGAALYRTFS